MGHGGVFLGDGKTMTIPTCRGAIPRWGQTWCGPGETEDQKRETLEADFGYKGLLNRQSPQDAPSSATEVCKQVQAHVPLRP